MISIFNLHMKVHAPRFWFEPPSLLSRLLQPAAFLYNGISKFLRGRVISQKMSVPVICVGNVVVGGSGKTPVVRALIQHLQTLGLTPHIISRGYGGYLRGPLRVDPAIHTLGEVGDEPLMLSPIAPIWVAKDKVAGATAAIAAGATVLILDDGLQNPSLHKDINFLVVDASRALGNEQVMPAGPLREPVEDALSKTTAIIWIGSGHDALRNQLAKQKPLLLCAATTVATKGDINGKRLLAFCGLGNAQKFYDGLAAQGATIIKTANFPDHYVWSTFEIRGLLDEANALNAILVTTAKDAVRIPQSLREDIIICDVELQFADVAALQAQLCALKP